MAASYYTALRWIFLAALTPDGPADAEADQASSVAVEFHRRPSPCSFRLLTVNYRTPRRNRPAGPSDVSFRATGLAQRLPEFLSQGKASRYVRTPSSARPRELTQC